MRVLYLLGVVSLLGCSSLLGLDGTPDGDDDAADDDSSDDDTATSGSSGESSSGGPSSSGGSSGAQPTCPDGFTATGARCDDLRSWSHASEEKASNPDYDDRFGFSLAVSADGSTMAVGAYRESSAGTSVNGSGLDNDAAGSGAVYVFRKAGGAWSQEAYLKTSDSVASAFFGWAVALSANGDTLVASAKNPNFAPLPNAVPDRARAYVFTRDASAWQERQTLRSDDATEGDQFGASVAISGDGKVLAVGGIGGATGGFVHTYRRDGESWARGPMLTESFSNTFGTSVALSYDGSTLLVGDSTEDGAGQGVGAAPGNDGVTFSGAVSLFSATGGGYTRTTFVKASNASAQAWFGRSVAIADDGQTFVVGAPRERSPFSGVSASGAPDAGAPLDQAGAAYIFHKDGAGWHETFVKAGNTRALANFGEKVAISANGTTVLVGAPGETSNATKVGGDMSDDSEQERGAAYVFSPNADGDWTARAYLKPSATGDRFQFGGSVGLSGNGSEALVGAIEPGRILPYGSVNSFLATAP